MVVLNGMQTAAGGSDASNRSEVSKAMTYF